MSMFSFASIIMLLVLSVELLPLLMHVMHLLAVTCSMVDGALVVDDDSIEEDEVVAVLLLLLLLLLRVSLESVCEHTTLLLLLSPLLPLPFSMW